MDEFYLPEDIVEWLGLKKSEYLSKLIQNISEDDFQFEEFTQFDDLIPQTLAEPDWSSDSVEDGRKMKTFVKAYGSKGPFQQVVVGTLVSDQESHEVFIPILTFVTRKEQVVRLFGKFPAMTRH